MIIVRKAKNEDLLELYNIEIECFKNDILSKKSLRNFINHKYHILLVAQQNQTITGYILTLINPRHKLARHYSLAILPQYRRQSIAKQLLLEAESHVIKKQGIKLEIRIDNKAAKILYESIGYKAGKIKPNYYEDGCDAIEMIKILPKRI